MSAQFGVYIHIPYCLQRCTYCDFATYVHSEIKPPEYYVERLKREIALRSSLFGPRKVDTIYFGGGTPSLIPAHLIVEVISELAKFGYVAGPRSEITLEINPATIDEKKLDVYQAAGVNRFSVGAQSFADRLLKMVHREHNAEQTIQTLELLRSRDLNFSFDLLFALPTQTLDELRYDVSVAVELGSKHISPYCLTVPESHPLSRNRPLEDEQVEMFEIIDRELLKRNFVQYEISNYAIPGFESQHNLLYWTDSEYWGLGLSAHSYLKSDSWGRRFWNVNNFEKYCEQIDSGIANLPAAQFEVLTKAQSLTDFCYTGLRLNSGLSVEKLVQKFGSETLGLVRDRLKTAILNGLVAERSGNICLLPPGRMISNQIFEKIAFSDDELP